MNTKSIILSLFILIAIPAYCLTSCSKGNDKDKKQVNNELETEFRKIQLKSKIDKEKKLKLSIELQLKKKIAAKRSKVESRLATISVVVKLKQCDIDKISKEINHSGDFKLEQHLVRILSHQYKNDFAGEAVELSYIANVVAFSKIDKAKFYMKAGVAWRKAGNLKKAKDAFSKMITYTPNWVKGLARYSIFLSTNKKNPNLKDAKHFVQKADQFSKTKDDEKIIANARAEISLAQGFPVKACNHISPHYTIKESENICREFKHGRSKFNSLQKRPVVMHSVKYMWRKRGTIPTGPLECNESIYLYRKKAYNLVDHGKLNEALAIYKKSFRWEMGMAQLSEMLSDYSRLMLKNNQKELALKTVMIAAKLDPEDYHYGKLSAGYIMAKLNKYKYRHKIIELNKKALFACKRNNSDCLYQGAVNYALLGKRLLALKLLKRGKELFSLESFQIDYSNLKRGKKWPAK
jgi:hypothetical protein